MNTSAMNTSAMRKILEREGELKIWQTEEGSFMGRYIYTKFVNDLLTAHVLNSYKPRDTEKKILRELIVKYKHAIWIYVHLIEWYEN